MLSGYFLLVSNSSTINYKLFEKVDFHKIRGALIFIEIELGSDLQFAL